MELIIHPTIQTKQNANYNYIIKIEDKSLSIFIGNKESREAEKFDYIIEICNENEVYEDLSYPIKNILTLQFNDSRNYNILNERFKVSDFMENCTDGKLLIHCGEGISRSPSILIMHLMDTYSYTYQDAFDMIYSKRYIKPNIGFRKKLSIIRFTM